MTSFTERRRNVVDLRFGWDENIEIFGCMPECKTFAWPCHNKLRYFENSVLGEGKKPGMGGDAKALAVP